MNPFDRDLPAGKPVGADEPVSPFAKKGPGLPRGLHNEPELTKQEPAEKATGHRVGMGEAPGPDECCVQQQALAMPCAADDPYGFKRLAAGEDARKLRDELRRRMGLDLSNANADRAASLAAEQAELQQQLAAAAACKPEDHTAELNTVIDRFLTEIGYSARPARVSPEAGVPAKSAFMRRLAINCIRGVVEELAAQIVSEAEIRLPLACVSLSIIDVSGKQYNAVAHDRS